MHSKMPLGRLVAILTSVLAVTTLNGCQTMGTIPTKTRPGIDGPTDRVSQDIFDVAARKLLETLEPGIRVALRPVRADESVASASVCQRIEENLVGALHANAGHDLTVLTRTELGKLIEDVDPFDAKSIRDVQERTKADALVITNLHAVTGGLTLSFVAYDMRPSNLGSVLAATSGHFLPIDLERAERATAVVATRKAAIALANKILEDETLLASRLRFVASTSERKSLNAWLSSSLVKQLDEVLPESRKARWAPILSETAVTTPLSIGTETWDQGSQIQARFRVSDKDGTTVAEQVAYIASSSIPFGVLDERKSQGEADIGNNTTARSLTLTFETSRSTLSSSARSQLKQLGQRYAENDRVQFRIESHAAYHGGTQDPAMTAQLRASAIQTVLLRNGIKANRIQIRTYPHASPSARSDQAVVAYGLSLK